MEAANMTKPSVAANIPRISRFATARSGVICGDLLGSFLDSSDSINAAHDGHSQTQDGAAGPRILDGSELISATGWESQQGRQD